MILVNFAAVKNNVIQTFKIMSKYYNAFCVAVIFLVSVASHAQKNTLLDRSFWKKNPDVAAVQTEINNGNDPSQLNSNAFDPVVLAINEKASNEVVKFLLAQKGNEVNKRTHDERTYIFWAAYRGNVEIMNYLIDSGARLDVRDDKGYSALTFAAASGESNTEVYDLCMKNGIDIKKDLDNEGANALLLAMPFDKDFALTNYFVSKGLDIKSVDARGNTAFNYAAKMGNLKTMKGLLEKGVTYNDNAMIFASQGTRSSANTVEVYQYLESIKVKPTALGKNGETALHNIVRKEKQLDVVKYFLSKGVNVNTADLEGNTAFMNAASSNNDIEVIDALSAKLKDINQKNKKGVSALAFAVKNNTPEVVQSLLAKGADVKTIDKNGDNLAFYLMQSYSPQKSAAFESKLKMLEDKGLAVATAQKNGNTLYHLAVAQNDLALMKIAARYKLDINAKNADGLTALHRAAMVAQDDRILKFLVESGAKKETATDLKETAYDLALENEYLGKNKVAIDFLK